MSCPLWRWARLGAIVNPLGYSRTGAYGNTDKPDATADTPRIARLSELDVMNVLALVREEYHIDGMKHIPVFVSHGDADQTVPVESSRVMVVLMKRRGMTYEYLEIPGGPHDVSATALPKTVEFFDRNKRKPASDD